MEHVLIRRLDHLTGSDGAPSVGFGVETRDRPGPLHKLGAFEDDTVWIQVHGGLFVARAVVRICWVGEYSDVGAVRARTKSALIHDVEDFWRGRARYGYAGVATLVRERWLDRPFWGGPRTYGYEWVVLENDAKRRSWLEPKPPPRGAAAELTGRVRAWRAARPS
jgi:hypothetical protein